MLGGSSPPPGAPFRFLVPVWEAQYEELSEVSAIGRIEGVTSGVRFRAGGPKEWIVFWALSGSAVSALLMELAARGVSANTSPARFRYFQPGR
jgi:hypothetical protein